MQKSPVQKTEAKKAPLTIKLDTITTLSEQQLMQVAGGKDCTISCCIVSGGCGGRPYSTG